MPSAFKASCAAAGGNADHVGTSGRYRGMGAAPGAAVGNAGLPAAATGAATSGTRIGGKAGSGLGTSTNGAAATDELKYQLFSLPGVTPPLYRT
ncbi:hypothetical protein D3C81_1919060 [compost metagenome]